MRMLGHIVNLVVLSLLINNLVPASCLRNDIMQLNFTQMVRQQGYDAEEFDVTTEDGYVLILFHIKGEKKGLPVLLVHGVLDSADTYIIRGEESLSINLANRGYDVWAMNVRGNRYGMRNPRLSTRSKAFWEFTFQEHGYYDLTANIDFVLKKTNATKLNAVGHSQGNLIFYIMCATRPSYCPKVNTLTALAPISYCQDFLGTLAILSRLATLIQTILYSIGSYEFFVDGGLLRNLEKAVCPIKVVGYDICALGLFFTTVGFDEEEFEPEFFPKCITVFPSGVSIKNLVHYAQIHNRKKLAMYDYGHIGNLAAYKSVNPPEYDLSKATLKVFMLQARNDFISRISDTSMLRQSLPNVQNYTEIERNVTNHLDFVAGKNMKYYIFPYVFDVLESNLGVS